MYKMYAMNLFPNALVFDHYYNLYWCASDRLATPQSYPECL